MFIKSNWYEDPFFDSNIFDMLNVFCNISTRLAAKKKASTGHFKKVHFFNLGGCKAYLLNNCFEHHHNFEHNSKNLAVR